MNVESAMISSGDTKDRSTIGRPPAISDQRSLVGLVRTAAVGRAFWAAVRLQWVGCCRPTWRCERQVSARLPTFTQRLWTPDHVPAKFSGAAQTGCLSLSALATFTVSERKHPVPLHVIGNPRSCCRPDGPKRHDQRALPSAGRAEILMADQAQNAPSSMVTAL